MNRGELTDEQWAQLQPLLPPKAHTGRPARDDRAVLNGILWILRTGAPWRDLPEHYGPWQTVYGRYRRWRLEGQWDRLLTAVQQLADGDGQLDWSIHYVDGTIVRAHQHAAGGKKGIRRRRRWAGAAAASRPKCTCARKARVNRLPSY
jgi:transposase